MVSVKRKRSDATASEDEFSEVSQDYAQSDEEIDISTALTGKRPKVAMISKGTPGAGNDWDDDNDDDLQDFIRESIAKRDVKEGTELLKKTKGKTKIAKGEVGGGSFQSMGGYLFARVSQATSGRTPCLAPEGRNLEHSVSSH